VQPLLKPSPGAIEMTILAFHLAKGIAQQIHHAGLLAQHSHHV